MLDWFRGNKDQNEQSDLGRSASINALYQHVQTTIAEVREVKENLLDEYSSEGFSNLSHRFEKISKDFSDFTIKRNHYFYEIIQRSGARVTSAKNIEKRAKKVAQLFEKNYKNPRSYSRVTSRLEIDKLIAELENLEANCSANMTGD